MREPLFIVAPPRSYTSVIGGMLGQHPQTYGLPEVNLSHGDMLGDLWDSVMMPANFATAGLLRTLAQLHEGEQTDASVTRARQWILRRPHWSAARVFAHIQEQVGDRMLVEKSPRNVMDIKHLRRLLAIYPRANFLHLCRHPRTQGKSVLDLIRSYNQDMAAPDPEKNWHRSHRNILELSRDLAPGQYMRIKGEMLLTDPYFYIDQILDWLELDRGRASVEAMLHPENSAYACIGPPSAPFGNDPNFLLDPTLDFGRLAKIKEPPLEGPVAWKDDGAGFSKATLRLARQLGYD
jgi:hypothetical protein